MGKLVVDNRDWYERGDDAQALVDKVMEIIWELGLDKDLELHVTKRLYDKVKSTDYGKLHLK